MSLEAARKLAKALMFEGYVLYPYRKSSLKNRKRFLFGSLYPAAWAERSGERSGVIAELLLRAVSAEVELLFLLWSKRDDAGDGTWLEANERRFSPGPLQLLALAEQPRSFTFSFGSGEAERGGNERYGENVAGVLRVSAERTFDGVFKLRIALQNRSTWSVPPARDESEHAELMSLGAAHLLVHTENGVLISLLDPPEELRATVEGCRNDGVFPVLVGNNIAPSTALASPITLYDFPSVAPESRGDYYDATEIDEMLALRVRTLTDAEKLEASNTDRRAREIVERSERLGETDLGRLHGTWRELPVDLRAPRPGDRVRLRPRPGRDVLDLALAGELATVVSLEQDFEGRRYCTVTVDADPGRDLGVLGQPGHRFFFELEELERVS